MKTFSDIQNLGFTSSAPFVMKLLKYVLHQHKKVNKTEDDVSCKQKGDGAGSSQDDCCVPGAERSHPRLQWGSGPPLHGADGAEKSAFWRTVSLWLENSTLLEHLGGFNDNYIEK